MFAKSVVCDKRAPAKVISPLKRARLQLSLNLNLLAPVSVSVSVSVSVRCQCRFFLAFGLTFRGSFGPPVKFKFL